MGYVAVKGGNEAIEKACRLFAHERTKGSSPTLGVSQIKEQLYLAVDRVMGEGSLYAPDLAALALKQAVIYSETETFAKVVAEIIRRRLREAADPRLPALRVSVDELCIYATPGGFLEKAQETGSGAVLMQL